MKKTLLVIGAAAFVSGCVSVPEILSCTDPRATRINIVFAKNNEIRVSPGNANTRLRNVLRFKLTGDPARTVTVQGKPSDPAASWITGSGNGGDYIYICVDPDEVGDPGESGKTFAYDIIIPGVGKLDPEVTVRR